MTVNDLKVIMQEISLILYQPCHCARNVALEFQKSLVNFYQGSMYCGFWQSGQNGQNLRIFSENPVNSESERTNRDFFKHLKKQFS